MYDRISSIKNILTISSILLFVLVFCKTNVNAQSNILISTGGSVNVSTGDKFYDAGGPAGVDGNTDYTITLYPVTAGERVVLDFTYFKTHFNDLWSEYDKLIIYDGPVATPGTDIGQLMGDYGDKYNTGVTPYEVGVEAHAGNPQIETPTIFGATNPLGCLTLVFDNGYSGGSSVWDGWEANIITYAPLPEAGCNITITADSTSICPGEPVNLLATGNLVGSPLNTDFNNSTVGVGWASAAAVSFTNNVCASPSLDGSIYMWMQNAAGPRSLETNAMDVSAGGDLSFEYRQASNNGNASPCESPDQGSGTYEGIYVQYSIDGGGSWITFKYIYPNGTTGSFGAEGGLTGCGEYVKDWSKMAYPIPAAAQTASTKFRWIQTKVTSASSDNWGLDNVVISTPTVATITITNQGTGAVLATTTNDSASELVNPTVTTTYVATIDDGVTSCQETVTITVNSCVACAANAGTITN